MRPITLFVTCKKDACSRPSLDDVERISKGNPAKARGTGSRRIPHRLNAAERQQYEIAKQKVQGMLPCNPVNYALLRSCCCYAQLLLRSAGLPDVARNWL